MSEKKTAAPKAEKAKEEAPKVTTEIKPVEEAQSVATESSSIKLNAKARKVLESYPDKETAFIHDGRVYFKSKMLESKAFEGAVEVKNPYFKQ